MATERRMVLRDNVGVLYGNSGNQVLENDLAEYYRILSQGEGGHYGYPNFPPDKDVGGPFVCQTRKRVLNWVDVGDIWRGGPNNSGYVGKVSANAGLTPWYWSVQNGSAWGAQAYNRMKPAQPEFSALNFIYELKDLPHMLRQRFQSVKDIGNYWLALKFGWEPLLKDTRKMVNLQRNAQRYLNQLLRDNGKPVLRRITLLNTVNANPPVQGSGYGAFAPIFDTWFYPKVPVHTDRYSTFDRVWASGSFRYWLPPGPRDVVWTARMMAKIFGLDPTPSVVYNAIPWSWLVDWFTNAGDVIENLESGVADKLAADRFYVMRESGETFYREGTAWFTRRDGSEISAHSTIGLVNKASTRVRGDPFGLGTNPNTLTGTQLSILGALGLSRLS